MRYIVQQMNDIWAIRDSFDGNVQDYHTSLKDANEACDILNGINEPNCESYADNEHEYDINDIFPMDEDYPNNKPYCGDY